MPNNNLKTERGDRTLVITLDRPGKLNALDSGTLLELEAVLDGFYREKELLSAIITGAGERAFCAGADIRAFGGMSRQEARDLALLGLRVFSMMDKAPKPILAAVNGLALGGGCELAMACHIRLASEQASFGQPEVSLGLIPGFGGTQRLTRLVGKGRALEMMLTGLPIGASRALEWGLVQAVFSRDELLPACKQMLTSIHRNAPLAIRGILRCVQAFEDPSGKGFEVETGEFSDCFASSDLREGLAAFLEKRPPRFLES